MHALACESIEHSRQDGHQRLALSGAHLRDLALVQDLHGTQPQLSHSSGTWPQSGIVLHSASSARAELQLSANRNCMHQP